MEMSSIESAPPASEEIVQTDQSVQTEQKIEDRKLIRNGQIRIEVEDFTNIKSRLDQFVKQHKGYYEDENITDNALTKSYFYIIRVPDTNFESLVKSIESGYSEVNYKKISTQDVTEEYIDLDLRLKNKKEYLTRYNELLKKAGSVKEILDIQERTSSLEEEIETVEGKLKRLNDLISYSTLELTFEQRIEFLEKPLFEGNFFGRIGNAILVGGIGFVEFLIILIRLWPLWIVTGIVLTIALKLRKKRKRKNLL
jgi:hypothetical protein